MSEATEAKMRNLSLEIKSNFIEAGGLRTHYLECGAGFPIVLLHSGEFGGCAELSWEKSIRRLAEKFRVIAPDFAGYGKTEKVFSFEDMWDFRIRHITAFLKTLGLERAHFIGNSMGATLLLQVATMNPCPWPIEKAVVVSGGGHIPENEAREILNSYDGTLEHMRRLVEVMFVSPAIRSDQDYIARRHALSLEPGAWEATAASRFRAPWREVGQRMPRPPDYSTVSRPIFLVTGGKDSLRDPDFGPKLRAQIPTASLLVIEEAGHCPHLEAPDEFNEAVLRFLDGDR